MDDGRRAGGSAFATDERSKDGPAVTSVSLAVGVGLVCALLSALGTNLAFLLKHRGGRSPLPTSTCAIRCAARSISFAPSGGASAGAWRPWRSRCTWTLAPISVGQAVLAGGLVFLAVLAERFFGFELGRRQWIGIGLVAVSLSLLTLTGGAKQKPSPATRLRG